MIRSIRHSGLVVEQRPQKKAFLFLIFPGILFLLNPVPSFGPFADRQAGKLTVDQETLRYEVSVTLKLVQVYVTDKQGKPVTDLEKSDFEISDNGRSKEITEFERHVLFPGMTPPATLPSSPSEPRSKMNRKFFFFFDFAFNNIAGILESKRVALNFIDTQIRPGEEIGVISYSAKRGVTLHEYLTTDHKKIRQIIEKLSADNFLGRAADVENDYLNELGKVAGALNPDPDTNPAERLRQIEGHTYLSQVGHFTSDIKDLAKAFSYIPGFKNIILFSSGIANAVLYGSEISLTSDGSRFGYASLRDRYDKMCEELAGSSCVVYAVNVAGLNSLHFKNRDLAGDGSLQELAKASGGKYFDNINSYKTINEDIQNITGTYYILGYPIDEKWDGKFHKLKVGVKRKGCEVFGQEGYFNPKPFAEYSANEKFLQLLDLALSERPYIREVVEFPIFALPCGIRDKTGVLVLAKVPVRKIKETGGGRIEAVTLLFDDRNDIAALQRKEIKGLPSSSEYGYFSSIVPLPPGPYECRVVLRDMATGKGARGGCVVVVPGDSGIRPTLLPPFVLEPEAGAVYLDDGGRSPGETYSFDRSRYRPVINTIGKGTGRLQAMVRFLPGKTGGPEVAFSGSFIHEATQERTPVGITIVERREEGDSSVFTLELAFGELKPGPYVLYLIAEDASSGPKAVATRSLVAN